MREMLEQELDEKDSQLHELLNKHQEVYVVFVQDLSLCHMQNYTCIYMEG